ncbi:MAG TPA: hypothetical protein VF200_09190 [Woeseiaceae bacterium]
MGEVDLPPEHSLRSAAVPPPEQGKVFLYAAAGGFIGALLAILVAKILAGDCCCADQGERDASAASTLSKLLHEPDRTLFA